MAANTVLVTLIGGPRHGHNYEVAPHNTRLDVSIMDPLPGPFCATPNTKLQVTRTTYVLHPAGPGKALGFPEGNLEDSLAILLQHFENSRNHHG